MILLSLGNDLASPQVMCIQYWPPAIDKTETYGDIHIGIVKEEQLANFQIRTFRIWKETAEVSEHELLWTQFLHLFSLPFSFLLFPQFNLIRSSGMFLHLVVLLFNPFSLLTQFRFSRRFLFPSLLCYF